MSESLYEFQFGATLGLAWSLVLACASWGAFARQAVAIRVGLSAIPVLLIMAWVGFGFRLERETFLPVEALLPPLGYLSAYLGGISIYSIARWLRGWKFEEVAFPRANLATDWFRYSTRALLAITASLSLYLGLCVCLVRPMSPYTVLPSMLILFLFAISAMPHVVAALAARGKTAAALMVGSGTILNAIWITKLAMALIIPSGPGFGFPGVGFFGPITLGFAAGALGLQFAYLLVTYFLGLRLTGGTFTQAPSVS
ncbi:hypothetical protein Pla108_09610 [Botrimarina colliarenosi]|uniref:Uncharacterized protein n=1 Tax=Botrimarina colliarenosi TaxID=2528001 RepID=A0A5C6AKL2_9BACT|nr:hypothetical protein [Botrimarina colliarenosi]TWU00018.1 hypothetical protein Pla108_09610 [Botrimarina colliarenosi]